MMMRMFGVVLAAAALILSPLSADAKGGGRSGSRPSYGGGTHTSSHGGGYKGGSGSSHKGGTYKNPKTDDRYGTHK